MSHNYPDSQQPHSDEFVLSMELWPAPFDSPEVPDESELRRFLKGECADSDLQAHIDQSVDCQRAIALLADDGANQGQKDADFAAMRNALLEAAAAHPQSNQKSDPVLPFPDTRETESPPKMGELFATSRQVEQWNGKQLVTGFTFKPLDVFLLDDGHPLPFGDTIFRAVACSPADHWPAEFRADDESVADFGRLGQFVIHWWLNYPVSRSQLTRKIGAVHGRQASCVIEPGDFQPAGPDPDIENDELWLERDRLHACAAYLGANAHARRMAAEDENWEPKLDDKGNSQSQQELTASKDPESLKFADADEPIPVNINDFSSWEPEESQTSIAASDYDSERPLRSRSFRVVDHPNITIRISEAVDPGMFALEVLHDPDDYLRDARILDSQGEPIGKIEGGCAYLSWPAPRLLVLRSNEGNRIQLEELSHDK